MTASAETQKTWTIVKFVDEQTVSMVPTTWIDKSGDSLRCLWPSLPLAKITQAIKGHQINTSWPSYDIITFRNATYDNYDLARKAAIKAEDTSDVNTDKDVPSKRRRTKRPLSSSSSENEQEVLVHIKTPPRLKIGNTKKLGKEPKDLSDVIIQNNKARDQNSKIYDLDLMEELIETEETEVQAHATTPRTTLSSTHNILGSEQVQVQTATLSATPNILGSERLRKSLNNKDQQTTCTCCPHHVQYLKEILKQTEFIKSRLNDITPIDNQPTRIEKSVLGKFALPIENETVLSELNTALKNEEYFVQAVKELSKFGGRNTYDFCARCLKKIISNQMATQYSWLGRRTKSNFSELEVSKLIIAAAEASGKLKDKKEVEDSISAWLRRATDRLKAKRD